MTARNDIMFPVVCFYGYLLRTRNDWESLVTTTTAGVKNGMFNNMLVVCSNGKAICVRSARKICGVGCFWGYNVFLNQRIKVELAFDGEPFEISVDDIRKRVMHSFQQWHGWQTRGDFDELKASVAKAETVAEIIRLVDSNRPGL